MKIQTGEQLARLFHETYEQLAPQFGYATRTESAVPWDEVPELNKKLMIAVANEIFTLIVLGGFLTPDVDNDQQAAMMISSSGTHVRVDFGKAITYFGIEKPQAIRFALTILEHCGARMEVNVTPPAPADPGKTL